jgi:hypothetical protein
MNDNYREFIPRRGKRSISSHAVPAFCIGEEIHCATAPVIQGLWSVNDGLDQVPQLLRGELISF